MPRHIGEVFLAGMVVNQADDEGPHDRTPLLIKREARPPLFPEYFAGRLKWFHATPVESARALEPIGRLTIRSAVRSIDARLLSQELREHIAREVIEPSVIGHFCDMPTALRDVRFQG